MKAHAKDYFVCPADKGPLNLHIEEETSEEIIRGALECPKCKKVYSIEKGVVDFIGESHYSESFGYQWNIFSKTQLDSYSRLSISKDRFFHVTAWPSDMKGLLALEVGCGSGRFTEVAAATGVNLVSMDSSDAVYANFANNGHFPNVTFAKSDLFHAPFPDDSFDRVFCLGVVQHTPQPSIAIAALYKLIKSHRGELAFDVYAKTFGSLFCSKYWLRPVLRRVPKEKLFSMLKTFVPILLRAHDVVRLLPGVGRWLAYRLVPVNTYKYSYPLTKEQNFEWALLDTFDMFSPTYDSPMTLQAVKDLLTSLSPAQMQIQYGPNGIIAKITK